jgi:hypothetical protein
LRLLLLLLLLLLALPHPLVDLGVADHAPPPLLLLLQLPLLLPLLPLPPLFNPTATETPIPPHPWRSPSLEGW